MLYPPNLADWSENDDETKAPDKYFKYDLPGWNEQRKIRETNL
jgi:hypothetical protein